MEETNEQSICHLKPSFRHPAGEHFDHRRRENFAGSRGLGGCIEGTQSAREYGRPYGLPIVVAISKLKARTRRSRIG